MMTTCGVCGELFHFFRGTICPQCEKSIMEAADQEQKFMQSNQGYLPRNRAMAEDDGVNYGKDE